VKAFVTDDQLLHDPQQFMRLGRIATDLPSRAHALRKGAGAPVGALTRRKVVR